MPPGWFGCDCGVCSFSMHHPAGLCIGCAEELVQSSSSGSTKLIKSLACVNCPRRASGGAAGERWDRKPLAATVFSPCASPFVHCFVSFAIIYVLLCQL